MNLIAENAVSQGMVLASLIGAVMGVMGRISAAGFKKVALVTDSEKR